jgi:hypothetical protein
VYSGDVPFADVRDFLVAAKVIQGEKPTRPDNVNDRLWDLWCRGWSHTQRPDMNSFVQHLEAMRLA